MEVVGIGEPGNLRQVEGGQPDTNTCLLYTSPHVAIQRKERKGVYPQPAVCGEERADHPVGVPSGIDAKPMPCIGTGVVMQKAVRVSGTISAQFCGCLLYTSKALEKRDYPFRRILCSCGGAADYGFWLPGSLPPKHFAAA